MNTQVKTQIRDVEHLKEMLQDGEPHEFIIALNLGLKSSKSIQLVDKRFHVFNEIDGSMQTLTESDLKRDKSFKTNIGTAIKQGALYHMDWTA